jgi:PPOX class probable F420-dependent enzyme
MEQFLQQKYLNLETFRKSGQGVKTPVWFAQNDGAFYVWTQADSGKAKRIRRDGQVKIAPCTVIGELLGTWVDGRATADASPQAIQHVRKLMQKKYGLAFILFHLMIKLRKTQVTTVRIELVD